jgi:hypothetical protein
LERPCVIYIAIAAENINNNLQNKPDGHFILLEEGTGHHLFTYSGFAVYRSTGLPEPDI